MAELEARFARFRQAHPRGSRVPTDLRKAVLAAVDKGVAPSDIHRACGISWSQFMAWRDGHGAVAAESRRGGDASDARVFSVIDDPPVRSAGFATQSEDELHLRLGPWSVSIRLAGDGRGDR